MKNVFVMKYRVLQRRLMTNVKYFKKHPKKNLSKSLKSN